MLIIIGRQALSGQRARELSLAHAPASLRRRRRPAGGVSVPAARGSCGDGEPETQAPSSAPEQPPRPANTMTARPVTATTVTVTVTAAARPVGGRGPASLSNFKFKVDGYYYYVT
jgi:hypothetical protein